MARPSRRSGAATAASKRAGVAPSAGRTIDSFGRVSKRVAPSSVKKATTIRPDAAERFLAGESRQKKEQVSIEIPSLPPALSSASRPAASPSPTASTPTKRKRKASDAVDSDVVAKQPAASSASSKRARRARASIADIFARSLQKKEESSASHSDTEESSASSTRSVSTAPTSPCESEAELDSCCSVLPSELVELLRLQAAFIKTLALHHAHHGHAAPVDLRVLCPSVAQAWGKRRVMLDDIQRCIGGLASEDKTAAQNNNNNNNPLFLSDYGRGKICIELQPDALAISTLSDQLNRTFEANLRAQWSVHVGRHDDANIPSFIQSLPKAPITKCASLLKTSAMRAKGQRTLEELMRGIALKKQEKEAEEARLKAPAVMEVDREQSASSPQSAAAASKTTAAGPPMNLLDRIRYRQLQRAQLQDAAGPPPTPEELERRAALHRASDIAEVLIMLCTSSSMGRRQSRISFGMAAILTKLRDSLRLPIAREEAASCVRLLAREVAPQWIQLVSMGGREIVIMLADFVPSKTEIQSRVQSLSQ